MAVPMPVSTRGRAIAKCRKVTSAAIHSEHANCAPPMHEVSRRNLLELTGSAVALLLASPTSSALAAAKAPKGFNPYQDRADGYQFLYPFGWQEIQVQGQDVVYKDIIEPLESVSVSMFDTDKTDIAEFGEVQEVAETLATRVLSAPGTKVDLINSKQSTYNGHGYYAFEFTANKGFTRHALAVVTVGNGKLYTLTTGANERRWPKMKEKLETVIDSFQLIDYSVN